MSFTSVLETEVKLTSVLEPKVKIFLPPASRYSNPPIINFWKIFQPPSPRLFQPNPPIIRYSGVAICINIKAFNRVNGKQFNIPKTFLEYLENYTVAY